MLTPNEILAQAGDLQDYMTALRRDVHAHPELGGDEHRTQERILRELAEMGIEAHPCADTGVVGILYGGKPGKRRPGAPFPPKTPGACTPAATTPIWRPFWARQSCSPPTGTSFAAT